jgi:aminopeptidase-like protein
MTITELRRTLDAGRIGRQAYDLVADLYPLCRSITGEGVRETLRRLKSHINVTQHEVPSGTQVFDWTVPPEWNIRDAYVKNAAGERVIDFRESNLHVVSYSVPVRKRLSLAELKANVFTLPEHPDWIPHRTSYYREAWGFCASHRRLQALEDGEYEVCIDSSLAPGHLTYGEYHIAGTSTDEVLVSCHVCHPSLCNDNLSGVAVATFLARHLAGVSLRYSYRFVFAPGTIGSLTWLWRNEAQMARVKHGLVLACVGDAGAYTYKKSRRGNAEIDRAVAVALRDRRAPHCIDEFSPTGYDERQFCSPGFNLPVGCLMRTPPGRYPEYHTSADNLDLVRPEALADSLETCLAVVDVLEGGRRYLNQSPKGEPQLGARGLYHQMGGRVAVDASELSQLWVLNLSDGDHSLLEIAERSGQSFDSVRAAAETLLAAGLLKEA